MNMKLHYLIIALLFLQFTGCGKIIEKLKNSDSKKDKTEQTDLEKREKEIELKERELALEKQKQELENQKSGVNESENTQTREPESTERKVSKINLKDFATMWWGTIRDGTEWEVSIVSFDGKNFKGRNTIYWKTTPDGFSTNFSGTVNDETGTVVMYEDKNAKGSGKFTGSINKAGNRMSGAWSRYSDGTTFNWNLEKMEQGAQ
jgi:hypothetical protein